jgi:O-antigen ligase
MIPRLQPLRDFLLMPLEDLACVALLLFFSMQGSIPGIAPPQAYEVTAGTSTALSTAGGIASQAIMNLLILLLILRRPRLLLRQIAAVPWLVLFAGLAIASSAWSLEWWLSLRRSLPFALAGLFGVYFAARFSPARQLAILRLTMLFASVATIAVVLFSPSLGLDHSAGHSADWQGIFTQKNACGRIMVLATAILLFGERLTPFRAACLALFLFILVRSGSRGAWVVEAAVLLLWIFLALARRANARLRLVFAAVGATSALAFTAAAILFYTRIAPLLGRDATLSGRTAIWGQVLHCIALRPWFGYGYGAFWRGMQGPSLQVSAAVHFMVVHAHNGFLEMALELGAAGLAVFLLSWSRALRQLWSAWRHGETDRVAWPLAVLVLIVLYDLDENTLLIYNGLFWILYAAAAATSAQIARDCHHTAPKPACAILNAQSRRSALRPLPQEIQ